VSDVTIRSVLTKYRVVAVVGLSHNPEKASYGVAGYLKDHGYRIIPVNPKTNEVLGEKSHKSLLDMPVELQRAVEIVDIFRPANEVPPIVEQAIQLGKAWGRPFVVWMQLGIVNEEAAAKAREAGLTVIMNHCMRQEHERLFSSFA